MKTIGALLVGGLWATIESNTAIFVTASAALLVAFAVSLRRV